MEEQPDLHRLTKSQGLSEIAESVVLWLSSLAPREQEGIKWSSGLAGKQPIKLGNQQHNGEAGEQYMK